jgi:hypothetical protein
MRGINRSAVIVMPAQPLLDWLHQADPTSAKLTLEDLRQEPGDLLSSAIRYRRAGAEAVEETLPGDL